MNPVEFFPFAIEGGPECGLTLKACGPMKVGVNDENRMRVFRSLGIAMEDLVSVTQIHSRITRVADSVLTLRDRPEGDGIITRNRSLIPSITVADCMPIFLFDPVTACFGVLHSGWRGTGIVRTAFDIAEDEWGARAADFFVILGPHVRSCCYTVDEERAEYFKSSFGADCIEADSARAAAGSQWPWRLSLERANRNLLLSLGVQADHITSSSGCTACNEQYGSCRREGGAEFTHMAAFIRWH